MGQNTDSVKEAWEAYSRGDFDSAAEVFHDEARWEGSNSQRVPSGGTFEGKDAIRDMAASLGDPWESFRPTPDEFIEQGDTVIVLGHTDAKAKETGKDIQVPFVQIWRMSGGKAQRVQALTDTAVVAEAIEA